MIWFHFKLSTYDQGKCICIEKNNKGKFEWAPKDCSEEKRFACRSKTLWDVDSFATGKKILKQSYQYTLHDKLHTEWNIVSVYWRVISTWINVLDPYSDKSKESLSEPAPKCKVNAGKSRQNLKQVYHHLEYISSLSLKWFAAVSLLYLLPSCSNVIP